MNETLQDYFAALDRLKSNNPINVPNTIRTAFWPKNRNNAVSGWRWRCLPTGVGNIYIVGVPLISGSVGESDKSGAAVVN